MKIFRIKQIVILLLITSLFLASCGSSKRAINENKIIKSDITRLSSKKYYAKYSSILKMDLSGKENKKLIYEIAYWMGTKYAYGGCAKKGIDCSCLIKNICHEVYGKDLHRRSIDMLLDVKKIKKKKLQEGDVLFFKMSGDKVSHVGLYLWNNKFLHASKSRGVMVSDINQPYYTKRFFTGGRIR